MLYSVERIATRYKRKASGTGDWRGTKASRNHPSLRTKLTTTLKMLLLLASGAVSAGPDDICGIFVATTGVDESAAGLHLDTPCRTINYGIARAQD